ncbi:GNAT family N-acetyltransferase [Heyndrickxia sp. NPDC080065]|uniref:GNAT family N-acetyltransferase n=1 Tax=Heyndrickxia sp. NPDC080065 TaxID=3390568 RepID=UPI003D0126A0
METITFENIYTLGHIEYENDFYKHYHYPEMLIRYDSNFLDFKRMPSLEEFLASAVYLRDYHKKRGQKHVKFYFPENQKPTEELMNYFNQNDYQYGFSELYMIEPHQFPTVKNDPDIKIIPVNNENFDTFLKLQYEIDLEFGEEFANQKVDLHKRNFNDDNIIQVLAIYKGIPAGSVDIIISESTAEIDQLTVLETFQRKGIGSRLQRYVMDQYPNQTVILVADGEDTPREMYQKQNYQYLGYKYECYKVYSDK